MPTILVVDDDLSARELLVTLLGYGGHRVLEAADGAEALVQVEAESPELIIVDLLMPTMDGFEFVRRLRANAAVASTPVVFYTASFLESEVRDLATACGVQHIITKPAEPERIFEVVSLVLGCAAPVPAVEREEARPGPEDSISAKLPPLATQASPRLQAMIDLGLRLASERDPERLLQDFCTAARQIIGARYSVVGMLDENHSEIRYRFASGMSREVAAQLAAPQPRPSLPAEILSERGARRLSALAGNPPLVGLPGQHPPVHSFLTSPIASPDRVFGWLCLGDKIGALDFNDEDEGLARVLAAQVGRIYENSSLYAAVQQSVRELEGEVAARKRAQDQLNTINEELEQRVASRTKELETANQELESFSYTVSHDLRAPLRAIGGYVNILLEDYQDQVPKDALRIVEKVKAGAVRMGQLIDDLLAFSRLGRLSIRKRCVDMSLMVGDVIEELRRDAAGRKVDVCLGVMAGAWGDPGLLQQVWQNLLANAFKFTRGREAAVIRIGCDEEAQQQSYWVQDNGTGFDMRYVQRLFGVFERLHDSKEFEGTGIGLSIVRRIVERHGGRVWAESELGQGATFHFTLPLPLQVEPVPTDSN